MTTSRSDMAASIPRRRAWWWLRGAGGAVLLLLAAGLLRARSFDLGLQPPVSVSAALPVTLPDGRVATLGSLLHPGRPTVINLWASWCGPCRKEAPVIADLHRRLGDRVNLVYLNVRDEMTSREELAEYAARLGVPADRLVRMDEARIASLTGEPGRSIPRTMVFSASGAPLARITGYRPLALTRLAGLVE